MRDLTTGSVTKHLLQLTAFTSMAVVFLTLYHLADIYWVGRLGKEAIAAVGLAGNLLFVVMALGQTLAIGISTLVSHATGAKDQARARLLFNQGVVFGALAGLAILAAGFAVRPFYFSALGADAATAALGKQYLFWLLISFWIQITGMSLGGALRGIGDLKTPMIIHGGSVLLNVCLDPVLIFGWGPVPKLGVAGASLATVISAVLGGVLLLWHFSRAQSYLRFNPSQWRPRWSLLKQITIIGAPAGAQTGLLSAINLMLVFWVISPFGAAAQAGFGVGMRVMMSLMMPVVAIAFATSPLVGQNFGARQPDRVRQAYRSAALLAGGLSLVLMVVCQAAPAWFIRLFSSDPAVVAYGSDYLRIIAWSFLPASLVHVSSSAFQGLGNTLPVLVGAVARLAAFTIPVILIARWSGFEVVQVWYLAVASSVLQMGLNLYLLNRAFRNRLQFAPAAPLAQEPASN